MESILADKIQNYITNLLGGQINIADPEGQILSSSTKNQLGHKINIQSFNPSSNGVMTNDGIEGSDIAVPLSYNGDVKGYILVNDDVQKFMPQVPLVRSLAELLIQQHYDSVKPDLDSTDKFICSILFNKDPNQLAYLASQAQVLGYRLNVPRMAFIIHLEGFWNNYLNHNIEFSDEKESVILRKKRDLEKTISGFFTKDTENITAYMGEDKFVLFKDVKSTPESKVTKLLQDNFKDIVAPMMNFNITHVSAGIGRARTGLIGLIKSCKEADEALTLGRKMWGDNKAYSYDELGLLSIVGQGGKERKVYFADQILDQIDDQDLVHTLECFFDENLNLTQTSEKLGIHRNTVIYRLDQIAKMIGKDPRNFEDAVEIKMALLIKRLLK